MTYDTAPGEFPIHQVWDAIKSLLAVSLGLQVNVDSIGENDFDADGAVTIVPPAARVLFLGETAGSPTESQNQTYNTSQAFAVLCADEDRGADPQDQRVKSLQLLAAVKHILIGARLQLADGTASEPVVFVKVDLLPTASTGMAYVAQFLVAGIAQFAAPNAYPTGDTQ